MDSPVEASDVPPVIAIECILRKFAIPLMDSDYETEVFSRNSYLDIYADQHNFAREKERASYKPEKGPDCGPQSESDHTKLIRGRGPLKMVIQRWLVRNKHVSTTLFDDAKKGAEDIARKAGKEELERAKKKQMCGAAGNTGYECAKVCEYEFVANLFACMKNNSNTVDCNHKTAWSWPRFTSSKLVSSVKGHDCTAWYMNANAWAQSLFGLGASVLSSAILNTAGPDSTSCTQNN
jgi:hypothetical protein